MTVIAKPLHIISFDNPFPPVYGGIVEVFYKLKPLQDLGYAIHLHCFTDVIPTQNPELEHVVSKVYYYPNAKKPFYFFSKLPFSVQTRNSRELLENLNKIPAPILFEGLKTTFLVNENALPDQCKILRLHNIEHLYFKGISSSETNLFRKWIFNLEAAKFKRYEKVIAKFQKTVTLSNFENRHIQEKFGKSVYIPVFHGNDTVEKLDGIGKYAMYHGDLRMSDNKRVVRMLVRIFKNVPDVKLVIASSSGEKFTQKLIGNTAHISFVPIKTSEHLKELLREAHINLVFSFQQSGTKLKLMNALYNSRFCFINENIMDDKHVAGLCEFADSETAITEKINTFKNVPFTGYVQRKSVLEMYLNDHTNAALLAAEIEKTCQ